MRNGRRAGRPVVVRRRGPRHRRPRPGPDRRLHQRRRPRPRAVRRAPAGRRVRHRHRGRGRAPGSRSSSGPMTEPVAALPRTSTGGLVRRRPRRPSARSAGPPTALGTRARAAPSAASPSSAIVATELASNLYKHADDGRGADLRALRTARQAGVELRRHRQRPGHGGHRRARRATATPPPAPSASVWARSPGWPRSSDVYSVPGKRHRAGRARSGAAGRAGPGGRPAMTRPIAGEKSAATRTPSARSTADARRCCATGSATARWPPRAARPRGGVPRPRRPRRPAAVLEHLHRALTHTRGAVAGGRRVDRATRACPVRRPRQHRRLGGRRRPAGAA